MGYRVARNMAVLMVLSLALMACAENPTSAGLQASAAHGTDAQDDKRADPDAEAHQRQYRPEPIRRYSGKIRLDERGRPREGSRKTLPERSGEAIIP